MAKITIDKLRSIIQEIVEQEMKSYKQEILKEIKSELFDVLVETKSRPKSVLESVAVVEEEWPSMNFNTSNLKQLFNEMNPKESIAPVATRPKFELPPTFTAIPATEEQKQSVNKVAETIFNKDYSKLMKKLGV